MFSSHLLKRSGSEIYLIGQSEDEQEEESITQHNCMFMCCGQLIDKLLQGKHDGWIRLPNNSYSSQRQPRTTIDDYLDPWSPVNIEVLLADQQEELNSYENDLFLKKGYKKSIISSYTDEEDAQFLSEHSISAILIKNPKSHQHAVPLFSNNIRDRTSNRNMDVTVPLKIASSSNSSINTNRIFAIKPTPTLDIVRERQRLSLAVTDLEEFSISPQEMTPYKKHSNAIPSPSVSSGSDSSSVSLALSEQQEEQSDLHRPLPHHVGSSNSLYVFTNKSGPLLAPSSIPTSQRITLLPTNTYYTSSIPNKDFPVTTLTRVPYQVVPPPRVSSSSASNSNTASITTLTTINNASVRPFISFPKNQSTISARRPSVTAIAQGVFGNKLDDITGKFASIKNNIITSLDGDKDRSDQNHSYKLLSSFTGSADVNIEESKSSNSHWDNFIISKLKISQSSNSKVFLQKQQRNATSEPYTSSLLDANFDLNNSSYCETRVDNSSNNNNNSSAGHQDQERHNQITSRPSSQPPSSAANTIINITEQDEEPLFDFSNVVAISKKNVKTFSEGVVGNGIKMFSTLSTRIKNVQQQQHQELKSRKENDSA